MMNTLFFPGLTLLTAGAGIWVGDGSYRAAMFRAVWECGRFCAIADAMQRATLVVALPDARPQGDYKGRPYGIDLCAVAVIADAARETTGVGTPALPLARRTPSAPPLR
jgi:hypothetical protein